MFWHLVIRVLQDGKELFCSKLTDLALRRFSCELLCGGDQSNLLYNRRLRRGEICQKNLDCRCWKSGLVFAEPNEAAEEVGVHFVPEEVEGRDVVVVDDMFAVVGIALVQLLADPIKELLELSQRGIGGININPVFDHLQSECKERAWETVLPFHRTHTGYPRHSEAELLEHHQKPGKRRFTDWLRERDTSEQTPARSQTPSSQDWEVIKA